MTEVQLAIHENVKTFKEGISCQIEILEHAVEQNTSLVKECLEQVQITKDAVTVCQGQTDTLQRTTTEKFNRIYKDELTIEGLVGPTFQYKTMGTYLASITA